MVKRLLEAVGGSYFLIAFIARLPFAMMVVGVLTLVVSASGSLLLGGLNSALVGIGSALFGPLIGAAADRFGQRPVLYVTGFLNAVSLGLFVWIVMLPANNALMFAVAFLIGASAPQISSMSRSRLIGVAGSQKDGLVREKTLSVIMAYESTVDEIIFVFGPFLVGILAVAFDATAPVLVASLLTIVFVWAFAFHRTAKPAQSATDRKATLAPVRELFKAELLIVVAGIFGMGFFFGSMLTSLTAFMQQQGAEEKTGLLYGVMGLGSAILALAVAFFSPSFTRRYRWLFFVLLMLLGAIMLQSAATELAMMGALAVMGLGVGPILVTLFSFGADRSPAGRNATVMTMLGSGIILGQSLSSAFTGWLSDSLSVSAALLIPLVAVLIIAIAGVINYFLTPSGKELSKRQSVI